MKPILPMLALLISGLLHAAPIVPAPVSNPQWLARHEGFLKAKKGSKVLFLGDSITDLWAQQGREVWRKQIAPLTALNFGIGGDRIEHVHWRVLSGELDQITPKVIVLLIGTNNLHYNTAEEIEAGYRALIDEIRKRSPSSRLVLMSVFPRVDAWASDVVYKIPLINASIARLAAELKASGVPVTHLHLVQEFLDADGRLPLEIAYDGLHLTEKGYEIWADAVVPLILAIEAFAL